MADLAVQQPDGHVISGVHVEPELVLRLERPALLVPLIVDLVLQIAGISVDRRVPRLPLANQAPCPPPLAISYAQCAFAPVPMPSAAVLQPHLHSMEEV